uniref:Uncharacterized protein n=1 Tax=viral metagenome TaxID=1070528 RepID=A0A6M3LPA5_9ZZZZ
MGLERPKGSIPWWTAPPKKKERMKPEIEDQLRDLAKDIPQEEWDELADKEREFLIDLILELFNQACRIEGDEIRYSHDGISIYKDAQAFLIKEGRIKREEC